MSGSFSSDTWTAWRLHAQWYPAVLKCVVDKWPKAHMNKDQPHDGISLQMTNPYTRHTDVLTLISVS
eukprot:6209097-Pleurochrysis_carterae.AAC.1